MAVHALSDATFDETVNGADRPVLVELTADWCPPCRQLEPILDELAIERDDLVIASLDTDANTEVPLRLGVMSVPTMVLYVDGEERTRLVGARGKRRLLEDLAPHLPRRAED